MDTTGWYTPAQTRALLKLAAKTPAQLSARGLLPFKGVRGAGRFYSREWVDDLARLLANYPSWRSCDMVLFELYAQYRNYHESLPRDTRYYRLLHHRKVWNECEELVAAGRAWTLQQLADELDLPLWRMHHWVKQGRLSALRFGDRGYLSARYGRYVVEIWTQWETMAVLGERWGISEHTIREWVHKEEFPAVVTWNNALRINPEVFRKFVEARAPEGTVSLDDTARRLGLEVHAVVCRISKGGLSSVGFKATRRVPEEEVAHWEKWFKSLNPEFAWLEPILVRPGHSVRTLTSPQTYRMLNVSPATLSNWCRAGLLPFYPASFAMTGSPIHKFVLRYIAALQRYAGGEKVTYKQVRDYKALCQEKGNIV
jgi:hypothetical protein